MAFFVQIDKEFSKFFINLEDITTVDFYEEKSVVSIHMISTPDEKIQLKGDQAKAFMESLNEYKNHIQAQPDH